VVLGTGQGLRAWQAAGAVLPPAAARFAAILLDPPREALRAAIATRFAAMLAAGALAEVQALAAQRLDPALPAMRAHGVPELLAQLGGGLTPAAAAARAVLHTGQYTKRQATWFRHHALAPPGTTHIIHARIEGRAQFQESRIGEIFAFIQNWR
jgi:tRNA dimethylallyltransferase